MAKLDVTALIAREKRLHEEVLPVHSLWQTIADHFYPERADFTDIRAKGEELADKMVDSYPALIRRDLGNGMQSMLRDGEWFEMVANKDKLMHDSKEWLESRNKAMHALMNDRASGFMRATKQCDNDYITFGQGVISHVPNKKFNGLLYQSWHLKDCTWYDDDAGNICGVNRRFNPEVYKAHQYFGDKLHRNVLEKMKKDKEIFNKCKFIHMYMPSDMYGDEELQEKYPYVSLYIDVDNNHLIEEMGVNYKMYTIPRFQTVAGSQYAYSPATAIALPDARTLQAVTYTLLEAGERWTRPPIIATEGAIRSDVDLTGDGITWVDNEYDEKLGAALRTLPQDRGGFPIGAEMRQEIKETLNSAFYLNKLSLPEVSHEMTAYEVQKRMEQFRREALPLFAPIEVEYSGSLCENTFDISMISGFLGSPYDIPEELRGSDIEFKFKSPLSANDEEQKVERFRQSIAIQMEAMQIDPNLVHNFNFDAAFRDALDGMGAPASWVRDEADVVKIREINQQMAMAEQLNEQQNA